MGIIEVLIFAFILSIDAFAVAVCKGLAMKKITVGKAAIVGAWFGTFQAIMPLIGYFVLATMRKFFDVDAFDHWISFVLLLLIGANMIREALSEKECDENGCEIGGTDASLAFGTMFTMAVATSIDALAAGVSIATGGETSPMFMLFAALIIGVTTFIISMLGVKFGNIFGAKYEKIASIAGGCVLILLGTYKLLEGCGIIKI